MRPTLKFGKRKLVKIQSTNYLGLPRDWCKQYATHGYVILELEQNGDLKIKPTERSK